MAAASGGDRGPGFPHRRVPMIPAGRGGRRAGGRAAAARCARSLDAVLPGEELAVADERGVQEPLVRFRRSARLADERGVQVDRAPGLFGQRGQLRTVAPRPFGRLRGTSAAGPPEGTLPRSRGSAGWVSLAILLSRSPGLVPGADRCHAAAAGQGLGAAARRPAGRGGGGERCRRCPGPVAGKGAPARLGPGGGAGAEYRGTWRGGTRGGAGGRGTGAR
jgi:hypothetical protein